MSVTNFSSVLLLCIVLSAFSFTARAAIKNSYEGINDGILVKITHPQKSGAQLVKVQVVTANIFYVSVTPLDAFMKKY